MAPRHDTTHDFSHLTLSAESFPAFYRKLSLLRFPMPVAQVLELRYLVNHAVDAFREPPLTRDYRQFREALELAIDSFGIEGKHHRTRLLKLLTMLRELHVNHSLSSRDRELELRGTLDNNRYRRTRALRLGALWLTGMVASSVAWLAIPGTEWFVGLAGAGFGVLAYVNYRSLPALDERQQKLKRELNDLLRVRVESLNWKMLIHKLAFVLGFKRVRGIEVFRPDSTEGGRPRGRTVH